MASQPGRGRREEIEWAGNSAFVSYVRTFGNETGWHRKEPMLAYSEYARETSQTPPSAIAFAIGIAKYPLVLAGAIGIIAVCRVIIG